MALLTFFMLAWGGTNDPVDKVITSLCLRHFRVKIHFPKLQNPTEASPSCL
jgi:hypothetical protein